MKHGLAALALTLGAVTMTAPQAAAFDSAASEAGNVMHLTTEEAAAFSKQIEQALAQKGARVAMVFRSGRTRDRLPEGVDYTHGAFWVYQPIQRADGSVMRGYAVYNLYHGDGESLPRTTSFLEQDFPFDFAAGSAVDDAAIIIPSPEMQRRILAIMGSETYQELHVPAYSLISNASDPTFQNCNEFMLDVIAAAAWQTSDYAQIKANLDAHFEPERIEAGLLGRIFAPLADERLKTSDHSGAIETVTYKSLAKFMETFELSGETFVIERDPSLVH